MSDKGALHVINGERVGAEDGRFADSLNPATGEVIGHYAPGSRALADAATAAAREAFFSTDWAHNARLRARILLDFADALEGAKDELVHLITHENGKTTRDAEREVSGSAGEARFYAGLARMPHGRSGEIVPDSFSILAREAAGVAAVIVPWNAPLSLLVRSLAPALAAGCTTVIKSAPQTSLINAKACGLLVDHPDLAPGIVNVVNEGTGEQNTVVGEALVSSANVDVVTFTGSSATGKKIMAAAAPTLKRLSLELGGKSPAIVFPDADLDRAAREITGGATSIAGQFCMCASRILVHASVYDAFAERMVAAFSAVRLGPGYEAESDMGPLIDHANQARILGLIEQAGDEGTLLLKGGVPGGALAAGSFVTPTLYAMETVDSDLIREELFGPVISFERFETEDEAVAMAHATRYGLAASVHTRDLARGHRMARRLRAGTVWLNCHRRQFAEAEVGGFGLSGLGRLHGVGALDDFLETKHIYLETNT